MLSPGSNKWSSWQSLGGTLRDNSDPAVVKNADGRLQVFVVGTPNGLYYRTQSSAGSNTWSGYQSLGGGLRDNSDPAVIRDYPGKLEVFVVAAADNSILHKYQNVRGSFTDWSPYVSLGGGVRINTSPDSLCSETEFGATFTTYCNQLPLQVFVAGTDNALWHIWRETP